MTVPLNVPSHVIQEIANEQPVTRGSSDAPSMSHRSPSAIPAVEVDEIISKEEQTTSERYRSLHPSIEGQMDFQPHISSQQRELLGSNTGTIAVAVPLFGHQRDEYHTTAAAGIDDSKQEQQQHFLERLRDILIHPDLDNPEALTASSVEPARQVEWDIQCSAKFRWFKDFLQHVQFGLQTAERQRNPLHIAVSTRLGGRGLLLARFLQALNVPYTQPGHPEQSYQPEGTTTHGLHLSLIADAAELRSQGDVDLLIFLDDSITTFDAHDLHTHSPHIQLIVPYSIEHIDFSVSLPEATDTLSSFDAAQLLCHQAGRLDNELPDISSSAQFIAASLTSENPPLQQIQQLSRLDFTALSAARDHPYTSKRSLEDSDEEAAPNKRFKSEDVQSIAADGHRSSLLLEDSSLVQRLKLALSNEHDRRSELETNIGDLQYRFESLYKELGDVTKERDAAIKTAQQAVTRMNEQTDHLRNLKDSMSQLRDKLKECETNLATHSIPERAEIETFRQAAAKATENEEKATTKLESIRKDLIYAQTLYQDASTKAQSLAGENDSLTKQLAIAEVAASTERANLRQMAYDNVTKNLNRENKQLKSMIELRDVAIMARDEEIARLKDTNRGRVGTRGTSVPRSPRMNSPLKMDTKLGSSRHGSPAADVRVRAHPLRNN